MLPPVRPRPSVSPRAILVAVPIMAGACVRVEAGTDPGPLGYGPGSEAMLAWGYDQDPAPRPAPSPWNPPRRLAGPSVAVEPVATGPVPYNDDILAVCEHLSTVAGAPVVEPASEAGFDLEACYATQRVARVFRPLSDWKRLAACVEAAADAEAVSACAAATPPVFGPITEHPRESAVCLHIFAITIVEQLGPEPMLDRDRLAEFEPLLRDCVDSLVVEERADRSPAEYATMLACIERARTTVAAEACE